MKRYAFGIDLGGTTVKMGLFETTGTLLEMWEIPTRTEERGKYILADIADAVKAKMQEKGLSVEDVEGAGIGVPGPVDPEGNVLGCVNLGWGIFNVEQDLGDLLGMKVKAGNDANVAALGEMWQGGGKGYKNQVMITLGTGVGGGIILNGKILAGVHGAGGEIGHLPMCDEEEDVCGCGKKGCLEQYASATGIVRITKKYFANHPEAVSTLAGQDFTAKDIFDAAKAGDQVALTMVDQVGKYLGKACAQVAAVVDPEIFVIGGGVSKAGTIITDVLEKYYVEYAFHACRTTKFAMATLGNEAGVYGGVGLLL